jgi:hypothetical protein
METVMKNIYINDISKVELMADLFNHTYGLPGCVAVSPQGERYVARRTNGGMVPPPCKCTKDVEDPNCLFFSDVVAVVSGAGVFSGQGAVTLTQEFIKLEELSVEDMACLHADFPPQWVQDAQDEG